MLSLNSQEKKVLLFISLAFLIGLGLGYYKKHRGPPLQIRNFNPEIYRQPQKVNLNTANPENLVKIPGIGPELASRIIEYRQTQGLFSSIEELRNVKGIGAKKFEMMKEFITLGKNK
ncbi:MAG: helix-hairpin-helix domain-containing protein [Candidatus Omnitrophota bacterium]